MRRIAAVVLAMLATPATACLPPLPGEVAPSEEDRARAIFDGSETIVYGVLTRGTENLHTGRFRVIHSYKGRLRPGTILTVADSWGFDPPMCASMFGNPPPSSRGAYGVIAWTGKPVLDWISDQRLAIMFDRGWIMRSRETVPAPR